MPIEKGNFSMASGSTHKATMSPSNTLPGSLLGMTLSSPKASPGSNPVLSGFSHPSGSPNSRLSLLARSKRLTFTLIILEEAGFLTYYKFSFLGHPLTTTSGRLKRYWNLCGPCLSDDGSKCKTRSPGLKEACILFASRLRALVSAA